MGSEKGEGGGWEGREEGGRGGTRKEEGMRKVSLHAVSI